MTPAVLLRRAQWRDSRVNNGRSSIKFTIEVGKDGTLPFLDTQLQRKDDGSLDITVYRKPTHTDQYLDFWSHHPSHVKRGLVRYLYNRAITSTQDNLRKKVHNLSDVLKQNVYSLKFVGVFPLVMPFKFCLLPVYTQVSHWLIFRTPAAVATCA